MLVAALIAALIGALGLFWQLHFNPGFALALGAWLRPFELLALLAVGAIGATLVRRLRRRPTTGRPLRLGVYVATLTWLTHLLHTYDSAATACTVLFGLGIWGGLVGFGPRLTRRLPPRLLGAIDLILINLCLIVIGGELGLRLMSHLTRSPLLAQRSSAAASLRRHRYPPGEVRMGFPCNDRGYYDEPLAPPQPGKCRVTSVGDSFSAGVVPHRWHFTTVAERLLGGCAIDNLGAPSIGPEEYLLLVDEARPLQAGVVIVNLFLGNDLIDLGGDRGPRLWFDRDNILVYVVPKRLGVVSRELRDHGPGPIGGNPGEWSTRLLNPDEAREQFPWLDDPLRERATFSEEAFDRIEADRARVMADPTVDVTVANYPRLFELLEAMRKAARPAKLVVMLIPDEYQVNDDLWQRVVARIGGGTKLERDRPQRLVGEWLAAQQIPTLDLLPKLRAAPPLADGKPHLYHLRDTHFNARGNQLVGEALAAFLQPQLPPPATP